jgi:hypothetical protein
LFLFFLLAFEGTFGAVNVFLAYYTAFFTLMPVPPADVLDGFDLGEFAVVNVDVLGDPDEGFVHVLDGVFVVAFLDEVGFVGGVDHLVEGFDLGVQQDDGDGLEGDECGDVFDGVVVLVHADVGEEVDEVEEVVPFGSPIFVVFGDGAEVLFIEGDVYSFGVDFAVGVLQIFHYVFFGLYLEAIAEIVFLVLEEMVEDDLLVLFQYSIFALNEGGEQSKVFRGQLS